jgi:prepilin-type N-terminal cleavage/methylation domain-containing protein
MRKSLSQRKGVTLVELLIVIAIITVLMGLLLLGVQGVRGAASSASCANNLRQIGLGYMNFVNTNGNDRTRFAADSTWVANLLPYVENRLDVFLCPSRDTIAYGTGWGSPNSLTTSSGTGSSGSGTSTGATSSFPYPGGPGGPNTPLGYIYVNDGNYNEFGGVGGGHDIPISWGPGNDRMRLSTLVVPNPGADGSIYLQMEDSTDWNWQDDNIKLTPTPGGYMASVYGTVGSAYQYNLVAPDGTTVLETNFKSGYNPAPVFLPSLASQATAGAGAPVMIGNPGTAGNTSSGIILGGVNSGTASGWTYTNYGVNAQAPYFATGDGNKVFAVEYQNAIVKIFGPNAPDVWSATQAPRHRHTMNALMMNGSVRAFDPADLDPGSGGCPGNPSSTNCSQYWMPTDMGPIAP